MDKNHPAYEQFQKWVRDNGLDREGIDLSVFWSCWIAATRSGKRAETVVKLEAYCPKCGEGW